MGFDWRIGTALIGGLAAKEVVVSQLGIVYSVGQADEESESLRKKLTRSYSPLIGFAIMLFTLISAPCMATFAVTWKESGSLRWALLQFGGLTLLAYLITIIVYQAGALFGIGL
jgi:ferrous iron transport protein B